MRTADAFPVGREATTGNASAVRRLTTEQIIVLFRGGRVRAPKTAIPHVVEKENRNTASKFTQIPKPQLQMVKKLPFSRLTSPF